MTGPSDIFLPLKLLASSLLFRPYRDITGLLC